MTHKGAEVRSPAGVKRKLKGSVKERKKSFASKLLAKVGTTPESCAHTFLKTTTN